MDQGLDTGAVLLEERLAIGARKPSELHDRLAELAPRPFSAALDGVAGGNLAPKPQPETCVTYAAKISPAEAQLDWRNPCRST